MLTNFIDADLRIALPFKLSPELAHFQAKLQRDVTGLNEEYEQSTWTNSGNVDDLRRRKHVVLNAILLDYLPALRVAFLYELNEAAATLNRAQRGRSITRIATAQSSVNELSNCAAIAQLADKVDGLLQELRAYPNTGRSSARVVRF